MDRGQPPCKSCGFGPLDLAALPFNFRCSSLGHHFIQTGSWSFSKRLRHLLSTLRLNYPRI